MIPPASVSLIVVSHRRRDALRRCLGGISQLDHPNFELIVVSDAAGRSVLADMKMLKDVKAVAFERANISQARNLGLAAAAGEIVAFIDDDAVPEPTWLSRLVAAFGDERVVAATGFVRARNGISFQYRARWVDAVGQDHILEADPIEASLHQCERGAAVKTEGTNMAFRRSQICAMGGFDPAFRFYLDEADLNLRQAEEEHITAVVPMAQVHHGYAPSLRRRQDRVPLNLHEIGASSAVFLRKHALAARHEPLLAALERDQRRRLLRHMVSGGLEPRDVPRLMATLERGIAEGQRRLIRPLEPIPPSQAAFRPFPPAGPRPGRVLAGWAWQGRRLRRAAQEYSRAGSVVTVFQFSPTTLFHRMAFQPGGYWLQSGGLWGRSDRDQPLLRFRRFSTRLREETARVASFRPVDSLLG